MESLKRAVTLLKGKQLVAVIAALVLVVLSLPFLGANASAQESTEEEKLIVSPPRIELDGNPGQVLETKVAIDNGSQADRQIDITVQNFGAMGEAGQASLFDEEGPYSLKEWIAVDPPSVVIPAGGRHEFNVKVTIPDNPPPGGRFGAVVFGPSNIDSDANVKVLARVTSLILLRVPGEANESAAIEEITASKALPLVEGQPAPVSVEEPESKKFFTGGPVNFNVRVRNDGNVQLKPVVKADIYNLFGSKIDTVELDEKVSQAGNVLPESIRRYELRWDRANLLGMYKAKVNVVYASSEGEEVLESSTTVWGAPVPVIAGILGAIAAFFLLIWLPRKRLKKALAALKNG